MLRLSAGGLKSVAVEWSISDRFAVPTVVLACFLCYASFVGLLDEMEVPQ